MVMKVYTINPNKMLIKITLMQNIATLQVSSFLKGLLDIGNSYKKTKCKSIKFISIFETQNIKPCNQKR